MLSTENRDWSWVNRNILPSFKNIFLRTPARQTSKQCFSFLKGPKLEIFGSMVFTQIRPVRVGDLGTRPKNPKLGWFRPENFQFILFNAVSYNAKDFLTL